MITISILSPLSFRSRILLKFLLLFLFTLQKFPFGSSLNPHTSKYGYVNYDPKHQTLITSFTPRSTGVLAFSSRVNVNNNSNASKKKNESNSNKQMNFFSIPEPSGLSQESIIKMARRRFGTMNNSSSKDAELKELMFPMSGKVAVITGAAGGIGGEVCRLVYSLGGTVVALDRNSQGLEELQKTLLDTKLIDNNDDDIQNQNDEKGGESEINQQQEERIVTIVTHHEDLASVAASADEIKSKFKKIDLLVNNAGLTYNPKTSIPGQDYMKSANGKDLAFTVNYLSHFLLTEKLLPNLSSLPTSPTESKSHRGRIVHVTSTYHWKVDGSEITPLQDGTVIAYESDPKKQSLKHVERSYGNTKLAQIWHSRTIARLGNERSSSTSSALGCSSVCACPTWAATGIGGEESRDFLERMAFPVSNYGPGITSVINAMFRTDEELQNGDALDDGRCFVGNSRIMDYVKSSGAHIWMTSKFVTQQLGWRDTIVDLCGLVLLLGQRFTYDDFIIQETSPESFHDVDKRESLYNWSYKEVKDWI